MQVLNLIRPEKSTLKYKIIEFPDGEPHIVLEQDIDRKDEVEVLCRITSPKDLFILMQLGDIFNRHAVEFYLVIFYLMSMRMDRVMSFNEAFSLNIVANMISSIKPSSVNILEPHSRVCKKLIECSYVGTIPTINYSTKFENCLYVLPDKGAWDRYRVPSHLRVCCSKVRDVSTGKLSGFKIEDTSIPLIESNPEKSLVVIDDLCDGGGTFAGIAAEIRKVAPDRKLSIFVTHMVNPKGIVTLSENYDEVYFTNSYKDWQNEILPKNVKVIEVI